MPKKKSKAKNQTARPVQITVGPEIRQLMRKLGLTEEEVLRMMRECSASLDGAEVAERAV